MTYTVTGEGLAELSAELEKTPGVDMVAPFGTSLHVSGRDHAALRGGDPKYRGDPTLDVARVRLPRSRTCSSN